jgi:hypothetical protein
VEFQLELAVEIEAHGVMVAVTRRIPQSFQQDVFGNAGFPGKGVNFMPKRPSRLGNLGLLTWYGREVTEIVNQAVNPFGVSGARAREFFRETFGVRSRPIGLRPDPE